MKRYRDEKKNVRSNIVASYFSNMCETAELLAYNCFYAKIILIEGNKLIE